MKKRVVDFVEYMRLKQLSSKEEGECPATIQWPVETSRDKEDVPFNQHKILHEKSSLQRCSKEKRRGKDEGDSTSIPPERTGNTVLNPDETLPISAKRLRKIITVGDEQSERAKEDVTLNQTPEKTLTGGQDPTKTLPASAKWPVETSRDKEDVPFNQHKILYEKSSLQRCSKKKRSGKDEGDSTSIPPERTGNTVLNPDETLPIPAKRLRKIITVRGVQIVRAKEDVTLNKKPEKILTGGRDPTKTLPPSAKYPIGFTRPKRSVSSSFIMSILREGGAVNLSLSPRAFGLYKSGMPLQGVLQQLGIEDTVVYSSSATMSVTLELKGGELSVSEESLRAQYSF